MYSKSQCARQFERTRLFRWPFNT